MLEKRLKAVPAQLFAANGTADGIVTIPDTSLFKVKQHVIVAASTLPNLDKLEVKNIISPTQMVVGLQTTNIFLPFDISAYTAALGANIFANEQRRPTITSDDFERACYEEEPTVAKRVVMVDKFGNKYDDSNPIPVNASVSVGDVNVDLNFDPNDPDGTLSSNTGAWIRSADGSLITSTVDGPKKRLDVDIGGAVVNVDVNGFDPTDPDSVLMVGSEDGSESGTKHAARIDSELDLRVGISDGVNKAAVSGAGELSVSDVATHTSLTSILTALAGTLDVNDSSTHTLLSAIATILSSIDAGIPSSVGQTNASSSMPVVIASDQSPIPVTATLSDEPIKTSGTENGQPSGSEFTFVNNRRLQILAAKDRVQSISYADFGTKDQRVTQIDYVAPSIGSGVGYTARKVLNYSLVGNRYRRDSIAWNLV